MMNDDYRTVAGIANAKHNVKKSRFFGEATAVDSTTAVKAFLGEVRERYRKASHYCYAYSIGSGAEKRDYATDAGEPRHSAGTPILAAIQANQLSNTLCVVTRYYGGINLGVGGLIRAYGRCARECLQNATIETRIAYQELQFKVSYAHIGTVVNRCKRIGGEVLKIDYTPEPLLTLRIPRSAVRTLQSQLQSVANPVRRKPALQ